MNSKKPWQIYVISIFSFFFLSRSVFFILAKFLGYNDLKSPPALILQLIVYIGIVLIIIRLINLEKWAGYLVAVFFALFEGIFILSIVISVLVNKSFPSRNIIPFSVITIIIGISIWYLIRPSFWIRMDKLKKNIDQLKKQKEVEKYLLK